MRADIIELGTIFCVHGAPETVNMGLVCTQHRTAWQGTRQPAPGVTLIGIKGSVQRHRDGACPKVAVLLRP